MKSLSQWPLVLFVYLGLGCQTREPKFVMHGDSSFTNPERACIEQATQKWEEQTDGLVAIDYKFDLSAGNGDPRLLLSHKVIRWTSDMEEVKSADRQAEETCKLEAVAGQDCSGFRLLGSVNVHGGIHTTFSRPVSMRLVADRFVSEHQCRLTVMHELGHFFGMDHLPDKASIMYPAVIQSRQECLTVQDLNAFCNGNACVGKKITPCKPGEVTLY